MNPTLTPELNPIFSVMIITGILFLIIVEIIGVIRKEAGDTITEHWRYANDWLKARGIAGEWAAWFFRIFTAGILVWTILHLVAGAE